MLFKYLASITESLALLLLLPLDVFLMGGIFYGLEFFREVGGIVCRARAIGIFSLLTFVYYIGSTNQ